MRYKDLIDFTLSTEDVTAVNTALTTIEEKLPFLIGLSKADIRRMANFGQKNETFTMSAIEAGRDNPTLVPANVSMAAVDRDKLGREQLLEISVRVQRLNEKLIHTRMALGADLYGAARAIYKSLQEFGRDVGLGDLLEELSRRFKNRKKTTSTGVTGGTAN